MMFDILIIGKGLMGCAALRHLTVTHPELRVGVIGPDEPVNRKTHTGVFASHYDQGRITRVLDPSPLWATLAQRSIAQYPIIEQASGIRFHHPVGCLRVMDVADAIAAVAGVANQFQPACDRLSPSETAERHPFFNFGNDFTAWDEKGPAGYINPRQLIQAQLTIAEQNSATIIREMVTDYKEKSDHVQVTTSTNTYQTRKILITAGGFTNLLLEQKLALKTRAHTILLAQLPNSEVDRLQTMPALITKFAKLDVPSLYMLPPVRYPDGKYYIKLGMAFRPDDTPTHEFYIDASDSGDALRAWFQSDGQAAMGDVMQHVLHWLLPGLSVEAYVTHPCLITNTQHGNPYIDVLVSGKVYVTTGGNGASAKSSDEIGRIGAMLAATNTWDSELTREDFRVVFKA